MFTFQMSSIAKSSENNYSRLKNFMPQQPYIQIPNSTELSPLKNTPPSRTMIDQPKEYDMLSANSQNRPLDPNQQQNQYSKRMAEDLAILRKKYPTLKEKILTHVWKHKKGNIRLVREFLSTILPQSHPSFFYLENEVRAAPPPLPQAPAMPVLPSSRPQDTASVPSRRLTLLQSRPLSLESFKLNPAKKTLSIQQKFGIRSEPQPQKRRKLVRGSRNPRPDYQEDFAANEDDDEFGAAAKPVAPKVKKKASRGADLSEDELSEDLDDSDAEVMNSVPEDTFQMNTRLLEFLNTADAADVCDIGGCDPETAALLVKGRPYSLLYALENASLGGEPLNKGARGGGRRKPMGLRIVEKAAVTLKGYDAVESLVQQCSAYGATIAKEIAKWGVRVDGLRGELEMTEVHLKDEDEEEEGAVGRRSRSSYFKKKPSLLAESLELKPYQQVGINWLSLLYLHELLCILADEMGLGKTCQVISFFAHLKEIDSNSGPNLVIVPSSTLENWLREFQKFCPGLKVSPYYGSQKERADLRYDLSETDFDVLVTTYNLATGHKDDMKFLRAQNFNVIVYDEGHMLKNSASDRYQKLMRIQAKFRLLLTGTPLQNNLKELISLLAFILPGLFKEKQDDLQVLFNQKVTTGAKFKGEQKEGVGYNPLLSVRAISRAKTMMAPFVLRRKKADVMQNLPKKTLLIEYCDITESQEKLYRGEVSKARTISDGSRRDQSSNIIMSLRKAAIHPLLFRVHYTPEILRKMAHDIMAEPQYVTANEQFIFEDMEVMNDFELHRLCTKFPNTLSKYELDLGKEIYNSGKFAKLKELLPAYIQEGDRILVFSLFTQVLDLLEILLGNLNIKFMRLDGQTAVELRQDIIDQFHQDESIKVFILLTKAGGFGINLACSNRVVILDQSFNPHDDRQAEDRAHRVGQTRDVKVVRMILKRTIEENIYALAQKKLALDQSVSGEGDAEEQVNSLLFKEILGESTFS